MAVDDNKKKKKKGSDTALFRWFKKNILNKLDVRTVDPDVTIRSRKKKIEEAARKADKS